MKKSTFTDEQIVAVFRDAEATTTAAVRKHGICEQSIYRWRNKYKGMEVSDVRECRRLKDENARLKKLLAERDLVGEVMTEIQEKSGRLQRAALWDYSPLSAVLLKRERLGFVRRRDRGYIGNPSVNAGIATYQRQYVWWHQAGRIGAAQKRCMGIGLRT